jgi:putative alpha-1,2-mannosidase
MRVFIMAWAKLSRAGAQRLRLMVWCRLSPNTMTGGDNGSGYSYEHTSIEGFDFTQMSGVGWYGDLGNFLVMPTTGKMYTNSGRYTDKVKNGYRSHYPKISEKASAGYYSALLTDYNIKAEATAAPHSGMLRFTFPQNKESRIQIDLARRVGGTSTSQYVKVVNDHTIEGWMKCTPDGGGWGNGDGHADYTVYFYAEFSKPLKNYGVWSADIPDSWSRKLEMWKAINTSKPLPHAQILKGINEKEGKHLGFYTEFATKANEQVLLKAGISFISMAGAKNNLQAEIKDWDFDAVHTESESIMEPSANQSIARYRRHKRAENSFLYRHVSHHDRSKRIVEDVDGNYPGGDGKAHQYRPTLQNAPFLADGMFFAVRCLYKLSSTHRWLMIDQLTGYLAEKRTKITWNAGK